MAIKALKDC